MSCRLVGAFRLEGRSFVQSIVPTTDPCRPTRPRGDTNVNERETGIFIRIMRSTRVRLFRTIPVILAGLCLASCASQPCITRALPPPEPPYVSENVILEPGDEIEVRFPYFSEYDDTQIVRPDGKISLPLIDEVQAAGLSPSELDWLLTNLFQEKIQDPDLTVILRSRPEKFVYVAGEIRSNNRIFRESLYWRPGMTVLDAVIGAGAWDREHGEPSQVLVVRNVGNRYHTTSVDLRKIVEQGSGTPVYLAANDIVYVPQNQISKINQWVDQNINKIFPTPFSVSEVRGDSVVSFVP